MKNNDSSKKKKNLGKRILNLFLILLIIITITILIVIIVFSIYVKNNIDKDVDETLFEFVSSGASTEIYYYEYDSMTDRENRDGTEKKLVGTEIYGGYRCIYANYNEIPEELINAFISIEDKRFWKHNGVDVGRTLSAGINYFLKFNSSYGGSSITQQLIKNVTENDDYSIQRKIQEIFWALDLEKKMSKEEILGLYLNIINLSQGCYGVKTAARYYFSKDLSELTLAECACIAAITNSPSYYDPINNPSNNKKRRDTILYEMYRQDYISEEEYKEAVRSSITLNISHEHSNDNINSWYVDMVIDDVINDLIEQKGYSRSMANLILYTGGLKIYTAMDYDVQKTLEEYYDQPENFYENKNSKNLPESSIIIIDPLTGDILGVVGSVGTKKENRIQNFATQTKRPPGSVLKPLAVYAPALEEGLITWSTVYDDTPFNFGDYNLDSSKGKIVDPKPWPKNANGLYRGLTNINYAVAHSVNTVTVKVLDDLGLEKSFDFLYNDLNIKSLIKEKTLSDGSIITDMDYASLALGQSNYGITVREATAAYSIFANNGIYNNTRSYLSVTDMSGNTVLDNSYKGNIVISEENASIMTLMLKNVIKYGTASDITLDEKIDCAGKTGTTQNNYDKWFIGYTPYFIGGVWYGYEYPQTLHDSSKNKSVHIWDEVMTLLHEKYIFDNEEIKGFDISENLIEKEYCVDSGEIISNTCQHDPRGIRSEKGYFKKGTEPTENCNVHILVDYDSKNGGVAFSECEPSLVEKVSLIYAPREFPMQIYVTDAQYTWQNIGKEILPELSENLPFYNNLLGEGIYSGITNTEKQFNRFCKTHFNYFEWKKSKEE